MSKELKIGDEVRVTTDAYTDSCPRGSVGMVVEVGRGFIGAAFNGEYGNDGYPLRLEGGEYEPTVTDEAEGVKLAFQDDDRTLNDATNPLQIPWGKWTREAKKEVFWAHHEGKVIQYWTPSFDWRSAFFPVWNNGDAYRVKPEPVRETVTLYCDGGNYGRDPMPIGTIVLEDGKPDRDSIKMESAT